MRIIMSVVQRALWPKPKPLPAEVKNLQTAHARSLRRVSQLEQKFAEADAAAFRRKAGRT